MEVKSYSDYSAEAVVSLQNLSLPTDLYPSLYNPIVYALDCGGKRLRPVLVMMACEAMGKPCTEAMNAAMGMEMFHNFTLLHDDVMDNSPMRRGRESVFKSYGINAAILSGDTMLTLATQLVSKVPDAVLRTVLDTFNKAAIDVYEGQALDMDFEKLDRVSVEDYIKMVGLKTGALLAASASIGALIGGADAVKAKAFYDFGYNLGLAFQIHDDFLDVYGDSTTFGKPIGGDILNNKKTFLLCTALEHKTASEEALVAAMAMPASPLKIKTVTNIFDSLNLGDACRAACSKYCGLALKALKKADLEPQWREAFTKLAEKLTKRKK